MYQKIDDLGYARMPPEKYKEWLESYEDEKGKQHKEELDQQFFRNY